MSTSKCAKCNAKLQAAHAAMGQAAKYTEWCYAACNLAKACKKAIATLYSEFNPDTDSQSVDWTNLFAVAKLYKVPGVEAIDEEPAPRAPVATATPVKVRDEFSPSISVDKENDKEFDLFLNDAACDGAPKYQFIHPNPNIFDRCDTPPRSKTPPRHSQGRRTYNKKHPRVKITEKQLNAVDHLYHMQRLEKELL